MAENKQTNTQQSTAQSGKASKPAEQSKPAAQTKAKRVVLRVRAPGGAFRRGGITFGRQETVLDSAGLTERQLRAIRHEPRLTVVESED